MSRHRVVGYEAVLAAITHHMAIWLGIEPATGKDLDRIIEHRELCDLLRTHWGPM